MSEGQTEALKKKLEALTGKTIALTARVQPGAWAACGWRWRAPNWTAR